MPLFGERLPETMMTPYEDGYTPDVTFAKYDPTIDDPECKETQAAVSFYLELKKRLNLINQLIVSRATLIDNTIKKNRANQTVKSDQIPDKKAYIIVGPRIQKELDELSHFCDSFSKNSKLKNLQEILQEYLSEIKGLGIDTSKIKKFNTCSSSTARRFFKLQTSAMNALKERKN